MQKPPSCFSPQWTRQYSLRPWIEHLCRWCSRIISLIQVVGKTTLHCWNIQILLKKILYTCKICLSLMSAHSLFLLLKKKIPLSPKAFRHLRTTIFASLTFLPGYTSLVPSYGNRISRSVSMIALAKECRESQGPRKGLSGVKWGQTTFHSVSLDGPYRTD